MHPTENKEIDPYLFTQASEQLILILKDLNLSTDLDSMLKIDKMFESKEIYDDIDDEKFNKLYIYYGSFLGECLKSIFNGEWKFNEQYNRWGVEIKSNKNDNIFLNPFYKIKKILNKEEDPGAILYWYNMVQDLIIEK